MSSFKKKINYSTHDTTTSLLIDAANTRSKPRRDNNEKCCSNKNPDSGIDYKKYINTLEKSTLIKDQQMNNNLCCEGKLKCCIKK
tara:strand:+ start:520 stop:774 length:255 start_codon:yes stop_codon:yes gene_type:complete